MQHLYQTRPSNVGVQEEGNVFSKHPSFINPLTRPPEPSAASGACDAPATGVATSPATSKGRAMGTMTPGILQCNYADFLETVSAY